MADATRALRRLQWADRHDRGLWECRDMQTRFYPIVAQVLPEIDDPLAYVPASEWSRDNLGEDERHTTYPSRAAAERQIKALRRLGGEWAEREYRARLAGGASQPEKDRTARVVSLRLAPATLTALDALATRWGLSRSATVARLATETR